MVPSASLTPNRQPAVMVAIMVWAHQLVRSSGPSTVRLKSFWALIWSSQLIGGVSSEAPIAAFLKASVMSGSAWSPAPDRTLPSRTSNQRPTSSSRALIWAMRLRSHRRSRNFGWCHAAIFIACAKPHRTTENLPVAMLMAVPRWSAAKPTHALGPALLIPPRLRGGPGWGAFLPARPRPPDLASLGHPPRSRGGKGTCKLRYLPDRLKYFRSGGRCPFLVGIR